MGNIQARPGSDLEVKYEVDERLIRIKDFFITPIDYDTSFKYFEGSNSEKTTSIQGSHDDSFGGDKIVASTESVPKNLETQDNGICSLNSNVNLDMQRKPVNEVKRISKSKIRTSGSSEEKIRFDELVAGGVPIAAFHGEFPPDTQFIRRRAHFLFTLEPSVLRLRSVRLIISRKVVHNENGVDEFDKVFLSNSLPVEISECPTNRVVHFESFSVEPSNSDTEDIKEACWDVFIPENSTVPSKVSLFLVAIPEIESLSDQKEAISHQNSKTNGFQNDTDNIQSDVTSDEINHTIKHVDELKLHDRSFQSKSLDSLKVCNEEILIAKAIGKLDTNEEGKRRLKYLSKQMAEREIRIKRQVHNSRRAGNVLALYKLDSLVETVRLSKETPKPPTRFLSADDGALLAQTTWIGPNEDAVHITMLIIALDRTIVESFAIQLAQNHNVRVIVCDPRGFGYSSGRRGYTPTVNQVFSDIDCFVRNAHRSHPNSAIILAGHMAGTGMAANYISFCLKYPKKGYTKPDGLLMLTPILGRRWLKSYGTTSINSMRKNFGGSQCKLFLARLTNGWLYGHNYVFKAPANKDIYGLTPTHVPRAVANYVIASEIPFSSKPFNKVPTAIFMGDQDEFINAKNLAAKVKLPLIKVNGTTEEVRESAFYLFRRMNTLQVICRGHDVIARWLQSVSIRSHDDFSTGISNHQIKSSELNINFENSISRTLADLSAIDAGWIPFEAIEAYQAALIEASITDWTHFEPENLPGRPLISMVVVCTSIYALHLKRLATQQQLQITRIDPWPRMTREAKRYSEKSIFEDLTLPIDSKYHRAMMMDINDAISVSRANFPNVPLILAGFGVLASDLVLNYSLLLKLSKSKNSGKNIKLNTPNAYIILTDEIGPSANDSPISLYERLYGSSFPTMTRHSLPPVIQRIRHYSPKEKSFKDFGTKRTIKILRPSQFIQAVRCFDAPSAVYLADPHDRRKEAISSCLMRPPFGILLSPSDCSIYETARSKNGSRASSPVQINHNPRFHLNHSIRGEENKYFLIRSPFMRIGSWLKQLSTLLAPQRHLLASLTRWELSDLQPIEMIGQGAFGNVWLVRHSTGALLAVKVIEKSNLNSTQIRVQIIRERAILAECGADVTPCPFIVAYVGATQCSRRLYILTEFLLGGELFTLLVKTKLMPIEWVRFYAAEILVALQFLHARGIVYRDLKPENIVLDALGHIRLIDFGFARHVDIAETDQKSHNKAKIVHGRCRSFCGSPYYIAPEILSTAFHHNSGRHRSRTNGNISSSDKIDNSDDSQLLGYGPTVDIWAFGVLLFELASGTPPFGGGSVGAVYTAVRARRPPVIPARISDENLKDLIAKLIVHDPEKRLGGAESGLHAVETVMGHPFFQGIDWERVKRKQLTPPHQPNYASEVDTSNFIKFNGKIPFIPASHSSDDDSGYLTTSSMRFDGF